MIQALIQTRHIQYILKDIKISWHWTTPIEILYDVHTFVCVNVVFFCYTLHEHILIGFCMCWMLYLPRGGNAVLTNLVGKWLKTNLIKIIIVWRPIHCRPLFRNISSVSFYNWCMRSPPEQHLQLLIILNME